jgi:hypothetical protein
MRTTVLPATGDAGLLAFGLHPFHLALLCLGKLCGDDDQAKVDHEERADLRQ